MKFTILLSIIIFCSITIFGQIGPSSMSKEDISYLYSVKTIEDFMDRFNDDSTSSLRVQLTELGLQNEINRTKSLKTCFNLEKKNLSSDSISKKFVKYVLNPENNCRLNFTDSNWFSKARCHFTYMGKELVIPIVLTIRDYGLKGVKWMIVSVDDNYVFKNSTQDSIIKTTKPLRKSINASSYAVNFLDLRRIFSTSLNEKLCFDKEFLKTDKAMKFINLIKEDKLKFEYATDLTFYFLQIPGYIIEVDEFPRESNNSGWLINKVLSTNNLEKVTYLNRLLKKTE